MPQSDLFANGHPRDRHAEIARRAFAKWTARGRPEGTSLSDWLEAESEVLAHQEHLGATASEAWSSERDLFWQSLVEATADYITLLDRDGTILFSSHFPSGVQPEDILGTKVYDLLVPEHHEGFRNALEQALRTGESVRLDVAAVIPRIEELRYYAVRVAPVMFGGPPRVICCSTDITQRKHADQRLAAEHAVARILAESSELSDAAPGILRAICESLGWDCGAVWVLDREAQVLRCVDVWRLPDVNVAGFERASRQRTFTKGVGLPGRVWASGRPAWIPDVMCDGNHSPRAPIAAQEGLHAAFGFPILSGMNFLGVIEFFSRRIQEPDEALLAMVETVGREVSQFIARRHAERVVRDREREFAVARQIQLGLLPTAPPVVPGFAFGGAARFTQETGGDYYDFFPCADASVGLAVGDASGHGIAAALIMAQARSVLRTLCLSHRSPNKILALLNRRLAEDLPEGRFVTFFFGRLDPRSRTFAYSNAGHSTGYVLGRDGTVRASLRSTNMPLGLERATKFPNVPTVALQEGDSIVLLTDGLIEAMSSAGEQFGIKRVLSLVRSLRHRSPPETCQALVSAVEEFCRPGAPHDDATVLMAKVA